MRNWLERFGLGLVFLALSACGGPDSATTVPTSSRAVRTISLSVAATAIAVHQPLHIDAVFKDANGIEFPNYSGATWTSADPSVLTVGTAGDVNAIKPGGPVTVTVTAEGVSSSVSVSIVPKLGVIGVPAFLTVDSSATASLASVDFFGSVINPVAASWTSQSPALVSVDANSGRVTGIAPGIALLVAQSSLGTVSVTVEVGVVAPIDGTWRGSIPIRGDVTVVVKYGIVRTFGLPFAAFISTSGGGCGVDLSADAHATISNNLFSFGIPFQGRVDGEFTGSSALTLRITGLTIPNTAYVCSGNLTATGALPVSGLYTVAMTRQ